MKKSILKNFLTFFGMLTIVLTLLPFVAADYWWIRMFDFPHLQLTFLTLVAIVLYFIKFDFKEWRDYVFITVLLICSAYQFIKIYPYTTFSEFEVLDSKHHNHTLSLFTANVFQENKKYNLVKEMSESLDADIMLFTETNREWMNAITTNLDAEYKNRKEIPLDNTYGMLLYSKLQLLNPEVRYLVSDSVPSIHTKVRLRNNDTIQLYAIHPTPPMPQENPLSTDRDAEMMMIAKLALDSKYPVIIIGDFNDVAWSQTSKLFQKISRTLDLRKGRGLYNTFSAKSHLMRWPLDHIFISSDFKLTKVQRCEDINSDHFPLHTILSYEPEDLDSQRQPFPSDKELKRAQDQIDHYENELKLNPR